VRDHDELMNASAMGLYRFFVAIARTTWGAVDRVGRVFEIDPSLATEAESENHSGIPT
jgi:hypothetical protein